jgi:hypothetical protein
MQGVLADAVPFARDIDLRPRDFAQPDHVLIEVLGLVDIGDPDCNVIQGGGLNHFAFSHGLVVGPGELRPGARRPLFSLLTLLMHRTC